MGRASAQVRLSSERVERTETTLQVAVDVTNGSAATAHAISTNPLRLSWRKQGDFPDNLTGWTSRIDIEQDIPPGGTQIITISLDPATYPPGSTLEISFVIEGWFWGHDIGVAPLSITLP